MKRYLISFILLALGTLMGHAQYSVLNGDLNHDGLITKDDVDVMADIILEKIPGETIKSTGTLSYHLMDGSAELADGESFNAAIKTLMQGRSCKFTDEDLMLSRIIFRKGQTTEGVIVSSAGSSSEIRAAISDEEFDVVYIFVDAEKLVFPESCANMFANFTGLDVIDWAASDIFIDTSNVKDMRSMFRYCSRLNTLDVTFFNTSNVTDMSYMFNECQTLSSLDVTHFDTRNVTKMNSMFEACMGLNRLDVTHFDTSNVTDMSSMFNGCRYLATLDVTHFDTSKVIDMKLMFSLCQALTSLNVTSFDTRNVTKMSYMFNECQALTSLNVSNFDTGKVTDMSSMFNSCFNLSSLELGSNFSITDGCNIGDILAAVPWGGSASTCTITCTEATQSKLLDVATTGIEPSKIKWILLN